MSLLYRGVEKREEAVRGGEGQTLNHTQKEERREKAQFILLVGLWVSFVGIGKKGFLRKK